jgi:NAD(P)-dependent dehydrogenase (short-subunit alcohol dehydrogenase family)
MSQQQKEIPMTTPLHSLDFTDKVALVTGGTSGIGEAVVHAYAAAGAKVAFTGRRAERGAEVAQAVAAAGGTAHFIQGDASSEESIAAAVKETVSSFGGLHATFNNAGVEGDVFVPTAEQTKDNYQNVFDINVWGVLTSMKYQIPALLESGGAMSLAKFLPLMVDTPRSRKDIRTLSVGQGSKERLAN